MAFSMRNHQKKKIIRKYNYNMHIVYNNDIINIFSVTVTQVVKYLDCHT